MRSLRYTLFLCSLQLAAFGQSFQTQYEAMIQAAQQKNYAEAVDIGQAITPEAVEVLGEDSKQLGSFYYNLGNFSVSAQQWEVAEGAYQKSLAIRKKLGGNTHPDYLKTLNKVAQLYLLTGKPEEAVALYQTLKSLSTPGEPAHTEASLRLASLYISAQQFDKATPQVDSALASLAPQPKSLLYAQALDLKGTILYEQGAYAQANERFTQAQEIYEIAGKNNTAGYFKVLNNLLVTNDALGKQAETIPYYQKLLTFQEKQFGVNSDVYLSTLQSLGKAYISTRQLILADSLLETALQGRAQNVGKNHPNYAAALSDLGRAHFYQDKLDTAQLLFQQALDIQHKTLGKENNTYAATLLNLGNTYFRNYQIVKAQTAYMEVADLQKVLLGTQHPTYARTLHSLGDLSALQQQNEAALDYYKQAFTISNTVLGSQHPFTLESLYALANLQLICNQYEEALSSFQAYIEASKVTFGVGSIRYATALSDLGGLYYETGDYGKAEALLQQSLEIFRSLAESEATAYINAMENLAVLYKNLGNFLASEQRFQEALVFCEKVYGETHPLYAGLKDEMAVLYKAIGKYEEAEAIHQQNLLIRGINLGKNHPDYAKSLNNMAVLYKTMGKYAEAEKLLQEALRIRKVQLGEYTAPYAASQNHLGSLYLAMGRYSEAKRAFQQALQIRAQVVGKEHPDYAYTLNQLASLYKKINSNAEVEKIYKEALAIRKRTLGEQSPAYAASLKDLADFYLQRKRFTEAETYYNQAIAVIRTRYGERHPAYASALNNLAILYEQNNQSTQAQEYYTTSLSIIQETLGNKHPSYAKALNNLALFYEAEKQYTKAETHYKEAIQVAFYQIGTNFSALSEEEKRQFFEANKPFFDNFMLFAVNQAQRAKKEGFTTNILSEAYNVQLATKAIVLNATSRVRNGILNSGDSTLIAQYKDWQKLRDVIASTYNLGEAEVARRNINLDSLEQQANSLEKSLSEASTSFDQAFNTKIYQWQEVQRILQPNEAAIEFVRLRIDTNRILYAALIVRPDQTSPTLVLMRNGQEMEEDLYYYKNTIKFKREDNITYNRFWSPLQTALTDIQKVYISPDGIYNQINLSTLRNPATQQYVFQEMEVVMVTNTKDLLLPSTPASLQQALLLGNPSYTIEEASQTDEIVNLEEQNNSWLANAYFGQLAGTATEVEAISGLLAQQNITAQVYQAEAAKEEVVKQAISPSILHIATHGFFMPSSTRPSTSRLALTSNETIEEAVNPMLNSGLVLAGVTDYFKALERPQREDGILTAYEAMNLQLEKTDLVVLSACETGLGKVQSGEGVYGLQRAFSIAGVRNIVMSLWRVDDTATQKLMAYFYEAWLTNKDKRAAFKEAQERLRASYPHPYYWGAFVMIGR